MDTTFSGLALDKTLQIGDDHHTMGRPVQQIPFFLFRECRNENCEKNGVGFFLYQEPPRLLLAFMTMETG